MWLLRIAGAGNWKSAPWPERPARSVVNHPTPSEWRDSYQTVNLRCDKRAFCFICAGSFVYIAHQSTFASRDRSGPVVLSYGVLAPIAAAIDVGLFLFASVAATASYQYSLGGGLMSLDGAVGVGLMAAAFFVPLAYAQGLYRFQALAAPGPYLSRVALTAGASVLGLICILFLLKVGANSSRTATIMMAALEFGAAPASRLGLGAAAQRGIRRGVIKGRRVVMLGDPLEMERLAASDFLQLGIDEIARIALIGGGVDGGLNDRDRERIAEAIDTARQLRAAEFALVLPWSRDRQLAEASGLLRMSPLPVRLYPDHKIRSVIRRQKGRGLDQCFSVNIQREPLTLWERAIKRGFDLAIAGSAVVVLSPLLVMTSLAIKLGSSGPVIFRQRRRGFDNREFVIFKFRTMTVQEDHGRIVQAKRGDERVTRVGGMLRRSSIDELPQLLNVIRGEMSLVGPRPHALAHDEEYKASIGNYALRHHVKPGVTGAAQVAGLRGETDRLEQMERRVEKDLWYIDNWSLALDLRIMAQTCAALLRHEAY